MILYVEAAFFFVDAVARKLHGHRFHKLFNVNGTKRKKICPLPNVTRNQFL